jgi:RsiW-degrading membrane proteinase PrsW (M82 family)
MPKEANTLGKELEEEYKRWRDYANVLLIALTVMFAGPFISERNIFSILSIIAGVIGILSVVCWHAMEYKWQHRQKPVFLLIASFAISLQAVLLVFHLITN